MTVPELPHNLDAERAVLGSVFLHRDAIVSIAAWFTTALFYSERNALIYQAMLDCYRARVTPNIRTVTDRLKDINKLDAVGLDYLLGIGADIPHGLDVDAYARTVERLAVRRALVNAGGRIAAAGYNEADADKALDTAQVELTQVATLRANDNAFVPFSAIVDEELHDLREETTNGTPTGFVDLDALTGGLYSQDLIILAARPSIGKTSMAGCLACNVAERTNLPVLFCSLEMGRKDILRRAAAMSAGIDLQLVRQRRLSDTEAAAYMTALGWAHKQPIYVDDTAAQTVMTIRNKVLRFRVEHGELGLVVIDYLQLMDFEGKSENRVQEVAKISRGLKQLAREADVPVLALSQLSRAVEGRTSHVPMLSDLRDSGGIEQDADLVMFIYREEVYDKDTDKKGVAELHIAKHRNGPIGVVPMRFDARSTAFQSISYRGCAGYDD